MKRGWFVTGTDTGVGKTLVAVSLLRGLAAAGYGAVGMKPVAAGCTLQDGELRNNDALALQQAGTRRLSYREVNPVALEQAVAPHLAAARERVAIRVTDIARCARGLARPGEFLVVEGAGGWRVPLEGRASMADLAVAIGLPVLLVVGIRLGCLNHALLSAEAIRRDGLDLAGWIAVRVDPHAALADEQIATLGERLGCPHAGTVPWLGPTPPAHAAGCLRLDRLVGSEGPSSRTRAPGPEA